jgi:hypothetical protein
VSHSCRYHAKRALYLAHVAAALRGHPELGSLSWECLANDPRRPVLVLHPRQGVSPAGFRVRLLPAAPTELSPLARLAPDRNSLRAAAAPAPAAAAPAAAAAKAGKVAKGARPAKPAKAAAAEEQPAQLLPTPHYNTSVLQVRPAVASLPSCVAMRVYLLAIPMLHALRHEQHTACCMEPWQGASVGAGTNLECALSLLTDSR